MQENHSQQAWEFAKQTLQLMEENGIVPSPQSYEVWYQYVTKQNPELVRSVEEHIEKQGKITQEFTDKIHMILISHETMIKSIDMVSDILGTEMQKVGKNIKTFSQETNAYGNTLKGAGQLLESADVQEKIMEIKDRLIEATERTAEKTQELELNLERSQAEIVKLRHHLETTRREANIDSLTGLATRKRFDQVLAEMIRETNQTRHDLSVMILDIDYYSSFKEKWGQVTADQIIRFVANCIRENIKGRDFAARYSGEVFAILLPNTSLENARKLANDIRLTVEKKRIVKKTTGEFLGRITLSGGVSHYTGFESIGSFIVRADRCLAFSRDNGRNCISTENEIGFDAETGRSNFDGDHHSEHGLG